MIRLQLQTLNTLDDAINMLKTAVGVEFGTLPPYLYALYSIRPGTNAKASELIRSIALQEMIHMCLVCNIMNGLGGTPWIQAQAYPGPLPGGVGPDGKPLELHLLPFSQAAMKQAMDIEEPEDPPDFPVATAMEFSPTRAVTIGQFYETLDRFLAALPAEAWQTNRNQIVDDQFFPGQLFAVNNYNDAHKAITQIVSEGEGTRKGTEYDPLDFQDEPAHYFRFGEIFHDRVLMKIDRSPGWTWGPERLGVDFGGVFSAIADPGIHDFSKEPKAVQDAQAACNQAFSQIIDSLQLAVIGQNGTLGNAVSAMYKLKIAARSAFLTPLADPSKVAGPSFLYVSSKAGAIS